jgi:NAD(P)-dependent dehydrogenase (short-subunit alcohol dehydrogenase family)
MEPFRGKVALVTGAGSGIGAAAAQLLAEQGAQVAVLDIDGAAADAVAGRLQARGLQALGRRVDVSDPEACAAAVDAVVTRWGALHCAVNNAGVAGPSAPAGEMDLVDWHAVNAVNYNGVFYGMRYQLPAIEHAGGGAIVVVSSMYSMRALPTRAGYTASKHGVIGLARTAAVDYATRGVRVNVVAPGVVDTPMVAGSPEESRAIAQMIPMRRLGAAREVAAGIVFLLSGDASYITGSVLSVDGGILA